MPPFAKDELWGKQPLSARVVNELGPLHYIMDAIGFCIEGFEVNCKFLQTLNKKIYKGI